MLARGFDPRANRLTRFAIGHAAQLIEIDRRHLDMQIYPVEKRPGRQRHSRLGSYNRKSMNASRVGHILSWPYIVLAIYCLTLLVQLTGAQGAEGLNSNFLAIICPLL